MEQTFSSFLRSFWLVSAGLMLAVGVFNYVVNPFGLFDAPTIEGFNQRKPEIGTHARMAKAYRVRQLRPSGLILGTSRAEVGLDPDHPGWLHSSRPVYNSALSSGRIEEALGYLRHAQAQRPLKQVVLALDFMMFNANWRWESDYSENRLSRPNDVVPDLAWVKDPLMALFSLDGLLSSIDTVGAQNRNTTGSHFSNGARDSSRKWAYVQSKGGHFDLFVLNTKYDLTAPEGWASFSLDASSDGSSPFKSFREIVAFSQQHDIDLYVLISPLHASKLEVIWQLGLGLEVERWKRELVSILSDADIPLWDFSGYNRFTTEPFPASGNSETKMENYWEGSHYKKHVGDAMLYQLWSNRSSDHLIRDEFGVSLDSGNLEQWLKRLRKERESYVERHQRDVDAIRLLIDKTNVLKRRGQ